MGIHYCRASSQSNLGGRAVGTPRANSGVSRSLGTGKIEVSHHHIGVVFWVFIKSTILTFNVFVLQIKDVSWGTAISDQRPGMCMLFIKIDDDDEKEDVNILPKRSHLTAIRLT